ncbi:MAG: archaemetzincin family Zn-dependent metalloprotease [Bryobacteraceae bacterium]
MIEGVDLIRAGADGRKAPALDLLDRLAAVLARRLGVSARVNAPVFDIAFAADPVRGQYYSSSVLAALPAPAAGRAALAVTEADLYVPVLTFVFGEAQLGGPRAIVSVHRLRDEYYGQPRDEAKLDARLAKEALHELGHTLGLRHCDDWRCVMASSHAVERLDLKECQYCPHCARRIGR